MKTFCLSLLLILTLLPSCHRYEEFDSDAYGVFDALWATVDTHYCFFGEKDVDWNEVGNRYRAKLVDGITSEELFEVCCEMLAELKDGHVNLASGFDVFYYRDWWSAYPQDFDWRVVQQYYLDFDYKISSGLIYKVLPQNIGYIRYESFTLPVGEGNLDYVFNELSVCDALIIDVRDNGGGEMTNINRFLARFIHQPVLAGYIVHKTGPGHDEFSEPYPFKCNPADKGRIVWNKPVVILTNRACFSAANNFVAVMKWLPNVRIVGAKTGGGGGLPFTYQLPNGWRVRLSASPVYDAQGNNIENGVEPSEGCEVHCTTEELISGRDAILDFAITLFE